VAKKIRTKLTDMLELPKEVILNLPLISIIGSEEISIENYKGIVEYTSERIRINTSCGVLKIEGRNMILKQITSENMLIKGNILKFEYLV